MSARKWWNQVQRVTSGKRIQRERRFLRLTTEALELRVLLANSTFKDGVLEIRAIDTGVPGQSGETLVLTSNNGNVILNGMSPITGQVVPSNGVKAIHIFGSPGGDDIDLRGVTQAAFANVRDNYIVVVGGDGVDTVDGSSFADMIDGGDGNDTLKAYAGSDTVIGGMGNDTIFERLRRGQV